MLQKIFCGYSAIFSKHLHSRYMHSKLSIMQIAVLINYHPSTNEIIHRAGKNGNRIEVSSNGCTFQTVVWHWCGSADRLVPLLFFHYLSFLHLVEICWQPFQEHLQAKAKTKNNDKFEFSSQWGSDNQPNRSHNSWVAWVNLDALK